MLFMLKVWVFMDVIYLFHVAAGVSSAGRTLIVKEKESDASAENIMFSLSGIQKSQRRQSGRDCISFFCCCCCFLWNN